MKPIVYTVREDHDGWYIGHSAGRYGPFETKAEAEKLARAAVAEGQAQGLEVNVEIEIRTSPRQEEVVEA